MKGVSGNPTGKARSWGEFRAGLAKHEQKMRARLIELAFSQNDDTAIKAVTLYYAYLMGKPVEGAVLAHMDGQAIKRAVLVAMGSPIEATPILPAAEIGKEEPNQVKESEVFEAPPVVSSNAPLVVPPEPPAPSPSGGAASGLSHCIYKLATGPCGEPPAEGSSWCEVHKRKLFDMLGGT